MQIEMIENERNEPGAHSLPAHREMESFTSMLPAKKVERGVEIFSWHMHVN